MDIINFRSEPKRTPFAPEWNYYLAEEVIVDVDFKKLFKFLKTQEQKVLKLKTTTDGYTGLGSNSTTAKHGQYNVFKWRNKEITKLKNNIILLHNKFINYLNIKIDSKIYINSWFNILRKKQSIKTHLHGTTPDSYLSGNICVSCDGTSTVYINPINTINDPVTYKSKNIVGKIILFQSNIPHYSTPHKNDKERMTIAFDLMMHKQKHSVQLI
tara:strand:- start:2117 stop:2755 length:639 start_codon:yes stop_codon:yes gene_type:complete